MSLKTQLLAFGLLTLVLPWAGYQYVQEMEAALRTGLEQSLLASASTVASALDEQAVELASQRAPSFSSSVSSSHGGTVYAARLDSAPRIDGVRDDWVTPGDAAFPLAGGHAFWLGVHDRQVYVFVDVRDSDIVYEGSPGESPFGDRLILTVQSERAPRQDFLLGTRAPGPFPARRTGPTQFAPLGQYDDRIQSAWQETPGGFAVEARVPLALVGDALGIALIDVDPDGEMYSVGVAASWDIEEYERAAPGRLVYRRPELERAISAYGPDDRFRVIDTEGWVLADTGPSTAMQDAMPASTGGLAGAVFRALLRRDDPDYATLEQPFGRLGDETLRRALDGNDATAWYQGGPTGTATVAVATPISGPEGGFVGAVLLEQGSESILILMNTALVRLMTFTLLATVVVALGLLGYATLLSFRVRRLALAAENALGPKGEIRVALPGRHARDELGDLSRSFADLLERLREHTQYLRTLAGKLSHELRTPLAVVSTSLDNLEQEVDSPAAQPYMQRLRDGTTRLDSILAAMSEATRMEQAIRDTDPQEFDLAAVVESCASAYADVYRDRSIVHLIEARGARAVGSGELVAQLIDKLIDNAVDFSEPGSRIDITLADRGSEHELSVANRGPLLPDEMRERLFDSLVSVRDAREDGRPHLGLGLYIVALIVDFHGGRAAAENLADGSGAVFRVCFPKRGAAR